MKKSNWNQTASYGGGGIFGVWLVVTFLAMWTHEMWIDEIYAWQISKFSIGNIFYEMRYEGHFALWYLILALFSHLGFPLKTLGVIAWALNAAGVYWFFYKAPFPLYAKVAVILTTPFLYVNPAISRCYVLIPLLLFLLASLYPRTQRKGDWEQKGDGYIPCGILLALLANTHVYSEGFVGIIGLILLIQTLRDWKLLSSRLKRNRIITLCIAVAGALTAFLQVLPSLTNSAIFTSGDSYGGSPLSMFYGAGISKIDMIFVVLILLAMGIYFLKKSILAAVIVLISNLYMIAICVFVYSGGLINRAVMWFYFVLFCLWITVEQNRENPAEPSWKERLFPAIALVLLSLFLFQPTRNISDFKGIYSGESRVASFVEETVDAQTPIFSSPHPWCCVIMEFLPKYSFYNLKDGTQLVPRADRELPQQANAEQYLLDLFAAYPDAETLYIMDCTKKNSDESGNIIERFELPFDYKVLYPRTEEQEEYFLQYYLLEVYRPEGVAL